MGFTLHFDTEILRAISRRRAGKSMREQAAQVEVMAMTVELHWVDLTQDQRQTLVTAFAQRNRPEPLLIRVRDAILSVMTLPLEFSADWRAFIKAVEHLAVAVREALEREHPAYQAKLEAVLKDALSEVDTRPRMTPKEFGDWLTHLSDHPK